MIWTREVNTSILNYVKTLMVNLTDHNNQPINIQVLMARPNGDIKTEEYPCVTIHLDNSGENMQFKDYNSYRITPVDGVSSDKHRVPGKYTFKYTLNFWSKNPMNLDAMVKRYVMNTPRYTHIDVEDKDRDEIHKGIFTQTSDVQYLNFQSVNGYTVFRGISECNIVVTVDTTKSNVYPIVLSVDIDYIQIKGGM